MKNQTSFRLAFWGALAALLMASAVLPPGLNAAKPDNRTLPAHQSLRTGRLNPQAIPPGAKPPLDLAVPAKIETATFALG